MATHSISLPADAVSIPALFAKYPNYTKSFIRYLSRSEDFPGIKVAGRTFVSLSVFEKWFANYSGRKGPAIHAQERKVREYLINHTATRAQIEADCSIRVPNVCRIVKKLREEPDGVYVLKVIRKGVCPITKHMAEFVQLVRKDEAR